MDSTTLEQQIAALRAGEATVHQQVEDVGVKIDNWLDAMRDGQAALLTSLEPAVDDAHDSRAVAVDDAPDAPDAEFSVSEPADAAALADSEFEPTAVADAREAPDTAADAAAEPEVAAPPPDEAPARRGGSRMFSVSGRDGAPGGGDDELSPEDADILAALDPKTAGVVQVRWRLSRPRRALRDILKELGVSPPAVSETPTKAKRSWWRRSNGRGE